MKHTNKVVTSEQKKKELPSHFQNVRTTGREHLILIVSSLKRKKDFETLENFRNSEYSKHAVLDMARTDIRRAT